MKLVSYYANGLRLGAVEGDTVWDLRRALALYLLEEEADAGADQQAEALVSGDMSRFISAHHGRLDIFRESVHRLAADEDRFSWCTRERVASPLAETRLLPPIVRPSKIVNIGNSYQQHIINSSAVRGEKPEIPPTVKVSFFKTSSAIISPGEIIRYPSDSDRWDFEGEFALVMGQVAKDVSLDDARSHVFGYVVFNDASIRDVPAVLGGHTSPKAKSSDTLAPFGPWIVTADDFDADPNDLRIRVWVNDELRQDESTSALLWPIEEIISTTSSFLKLLPGDLIATGSPAGVGLESGRYLSDGDRVRIEIEHVGVLENEVTRRAAGPAVAETRY